MAKENELTEAVVDEEADAAASNQERDDSDLEAKKRLRLFKFKRKALNLADQSTFIGGWAVAIVGALVLLQLLSPVMLGFRTTVVSTGSMAPFATPGDVIISYGYQGQKLTEGQPVVVKDESGFEYLHRIVKINENGAYGVGGNGTYTTRGDANDANDLFTPTADDITGLPLSIIDGWHAAFIRVFVFDVPWWDNTVAAATTGNWGAVWALLPGAPWPFISLFLAAIALWFVIPEVLRGIVNRANLRAAVELDHVKRSVEAHEETITEHDESISEIEPVVEEIREEKAKKEAEDAALAEAQAKAWDDADFTKIYDEPEDSSDDDAFFDVYNKQFDTDIPSAWTPEPDEDSAFDVFETFAPKTRSGGLPALSDPTPRFAPNAPTNPFDRLTPRVSTPRSEVTRASLRAETDEFAALGIRASQQSRNEASAFDLEEI